MHSVGRIDWSFVDHPAPASATSSGLARAPLVGRAQGAVHTDLAAVAILPGGWLAPHVHSFEETLYILEGELLLEIAGAFHRLVPGDYALMPTGYRHALGNSSTRRRSGCCRWHRRSGCRRTPGGRTPSSSRPRTWPRWTRPRNGRPSATRPSGWSATTTGPAPSSRRLRVKDEARGRASAGRDTALVVYSGISVKMLVDHQSGADHVTMFTVDYELGGAAQAHDHPFEEAYVFLAGEIEGEFEGQHYVFRPGDVAFAGVGAVHGFYNTGDERVRWIETQAPQPPARHSYRWIRDWERYETSRTEERS